MRADMEPGLISSRSRVREWPLTSVSDAVLVGRGESWDELIEMDCRNGRSYAHSTILFFFT